VANQYSSAWTTEHFEIAQRILKTCETVAEACAVLEAHFDRVVTVNAIERAFRRRGLPPPATMLMRPSPEPEPQAEEPPSRLPSSVSPFPSPEKVYLVCSDVHAPGHSVPVMDAFIAIGKDVGVHGVVIAGDYLDLHEVSRHSAGSVAQREGHRVVDSYAEGRALLRRIVDGIDCTDNYFIDGNHEDRIRRWLHSGDNAVWIGADATEIDKGLELAEFGFQYRAGWPEAHVRLGHMIVTHGRFTNLHHAKKHLDTWRCATMYGHTHRPQLAYAAGFKSQQVAIGLGHCADPAGEAMAYAPQPNDWCNGFGLLAVRPSGVFHAEQINFYDDVTSFGGRLYGRGGQL